MGHTVPRGLEPGGGVRDVASPHRVIRDRYAGGFTTLMLSFGVYFGTLTLSLYTAFDPKYTMRKLRSPGGSRCESANSD